jgi:hypothetical protein
VGQHGPPSGAGHVSRPRGAQGHCREHGQVSNAWRDIMACCPVCLPPWLSVCFSTVHVCKNGG